MIKRDAAPISAVHKQDLLVPGEWRECDAQHERAGRAQVAEKDHCHYQIVGLGKGNVGLPFRQMLFPQPMRSDKLVAYLRLALEVPRPAYPLVEAEPPIEEIAARSAPLRETNGVLHRLHLSEADRRLRNAGIDIA